MERIRSRVLQALALDGSNGQDSVCATDRLRSCFRQAEVPNLTLLNELLHRSGDFFDRHVSIDTMLVKTKDPSQKAVRPDRLAMANPTLPTVRPDYTGGFVVSDCARQTRHSEAVDLIFVEF